MRFIPAGLAGAFIVEVELHADDRGFFARSFCAKEFAAQGLLATVAQCSMSLTRRRGTVRGLHYQVPPAEEVKLVRCVRGAVYDVIVDLRPESPSYRKHLSIELSCSNKKAVYVPPMFAHGFQTLVDDSEIFYQMSAAYVPECARGVRFDDPSLEIQWPLPVTLLSEKDRQWPLLA